MSTALNLVGLVGLALAALGSYGVLTDTVPLIKRNGQPLTGFLPSAGVALLGVALTVLAGPTPSAFLVVLALVAVGLGLVRRQPRVWQLGAVGLVLGLVGFGLVRGREEVIIEATPANAEIVLDGKRYVGTTGPLTIKAGTYRVKVTAADHHPRAEDVALAPGRRVTMALTPLTEAELAVQVAEQAKREALAQQAAERAAREQVARDATEKARQQVEAKRQAQQAAQEQAAREAADKAERAQQAAADAEQRRAEATEQALEATTLGVGEFEIGCEEAVKARLKSPSTARFPGFLDPAGAQRGVIGSRTAGWGWKGYVDHQNVFGATVRTNFTCTALPGERVVQVGLAAR